MIELTKKHLEVIDYLDEVIQRSNMKLYNRYFNLGMSTSVANLEKVLGVCPWSEGMPDLTGKVLSFANGTSAYVIAQFKNGTDIFLQVSKPEEGELLKYDFYGYTKNKDMVILTVEDPLIETKVNAKSKSPTNVCLGLTDFEDKESL